MVENNSKYQNKQQIQKTIIELKEAITIQNITFEI